MLRQGARATSWGRSSPSTSTSCDRAHRTRLDAAKQRLEIRTVRSVSEVDSHQWNSAAGDNPFVSHEFLAALEESGSASAQHGWAPCHLVLKEEDGEDVLGVVPLYLKSHSYGEYVFDHSWAQAYSRICRTGVFGGGSYYPKLQSCVPFSPVTGPRLLVNDQLSSEDRESTLQVLSKSLVSVADEMKVSSLHVTFNSEEDAAHLSADAGYLTRYGIQYHWENDGYATFDDFLMSLRQSKRKSIRQERKCAAKNDLRVYRALGSEMSPSDWDTFYQVSGTLTAAGLSPAPKLTLTDSLFQFYLNTCDKKWGEAYLNRDFFQIMGETMGDKVMVVFVEDSFGTKVAGALNLVGKDTLYGRNWGCKNGECNLSITRSLARTFAVADFLCFFPLNLTGLRVKHLHFEVCYYQALEHAIEMGLARVEAGAQGEHKIQRGYLPTRTYSAHYIKDPRFKSAIKDFLRQEHQQIDYTLEVLEQELSPYKSPPGSGAQ